MLQSAGLFHKRLSAQVVSRKTFGAKLRAWSSDTFPPILAIVALDLALTIIFFGFSAPSTHIGTLRAEDTIAPKILQLTSVGLGLGILASLFSRAIDMRLVTFGLAFTLLLDLDHLPAFFGIDQPIRPAHSLTFLFIAFALLYLVAARGRPEIPVIFASAFFGHIAADSGVFAFLAPISFNYASLDEFKIPFAILAVCLAIWSGYLKSKRRRLEKLSTVPNSINVKGVSKKN